MRHGFRMIRGNPPVPQPRHSKRGRRRHLANQRMWAMLFKNEGTITSFRFSPDGRRIEWDWSKGRGESPGDLFTVELIAGPHTFAGSMRFIRHQETWGNGRVDPIQPFTQEI